MTSILHFLDVLGHYAVAWSWQLALLIAFLWVVLRFDRRHRPELRYRLLFLTLVLSALLPWVPTRIATLSWTARVKEVWLEPVGATVRPPSKVEPRTERYPNLLVSSPPAVSKTSAPTTRGLETLFPVLGFLWCAGAAAAGIRKLRQHNRLAGIVRRATVSPLGADASLPILLSAEVSGPMLYGFWRPVILLPLNISDWSTPEELASVVRHEFVHFKRRDHWVSALEGLLRTILFFHPMFRWACQRLDIERELVCDAEVLRLGSDPDAYAGTLLKVAHHAVVQPSGVHFASAAELTERVELLLRPHRTARIVLATVPLILLMPLASLGFWQATVEGFSPVESVWTLRFLPRIPLEPPAAGVVSPRSGPPQQPVSAEPVQNPISIPIPTAPQSLTVRTAVTVLRGQGVFNEVRIAVGIPHANLTFLDSRNYMEADGRIEGMISTLSNKVVARLDERFTVGFLNNRPPSREGIAVLQFAFLLSPGVYRMFLVIHDSATGSRGTLDTRLEIPEIPRSGVSTSSLVVADLIESGNGNFFTIGNMKVRPNVTGKFRQSQELSIFQQIYSDGSGPLVLETVITANGQEFKRFSEELQKAPELTITKRIPLKDFPPGTYGIQMIITDPVSPQTVASKAEFTVE